MPSTDDASPATRPSPRPRFTLHTALAPAQVRDRVNAFIKGSRRVRGIAFEHRIELAIGGDEHHFWSPQIVAEITPVESGGARIDCRFGPDPYVWALYLMLYVTMLVCFVFALIFGFVQLSLAQEPIGLYFAPGALVLAGLVYGASYVGQGLGSEQMYFLRAELTRVTEAHPGEEPSRAAPPA
jgi:hypothetical protein